MLVALFLTENGNSTAVTILQAVKSMPANEACRACNIILVRLYSILPMHAYFLATVLQFCVLHTVLITVLFVFADYKLEKIFSNICCYLPLQNHHLWGARGQTKKFFWLACARHVRSLLCICSPPVCSQCKRDVNLTPNFGVAVSAENRDEWQMLCAAFSQQHQMQSQAHLCTANITVIDSAREEL